VGVISVLYWAHFLSKTPKESRSYRGGIRIGSLIGTAVLFPLAFFPILLGSEAGVVNVLIHFAIGD